MADGRFRELSFWLASLTESGEDHLEPRSSLPGDLAADVAIVGAGFTGLWTALSLHAADPSVRIVVIDAEIAGFGASGRNGGWCSGILPMRWDAIAMRSSRQAAIEFQRAMFATVDEVLSASAALGIDCHAAKGGWLHHATNSAHSARLRAELTDAAQWGFGEDDFRWLERDAATRRIGADGTLGSVFSPHCAVLHPGRLVRGLAAAVERQGTPLYEQTRAVRIANHSVTTDRGTIRADVVVRATEAFTAALPGMRRTIAPLYSLMVVTEPLGPAFWDAVGWSGREAFNDARHMVIYGQRTADDRIAFGGRGAPYHFGSRVRPSFDHDRRVHGRLLPETLSALFPALGRARDIRIDAEWGGPLGATRDWSCSVGYDRVTGEAWAGGYVGDGVATSNLAGRTLADLILGRDTDLVRLPWVGHRSRRWEPEPLRWLGINAGLRLADSADRFEERHRRPSKTRQRLMTALRS